MLASHKKDIVDLVSQLTAPVTVDLTDTARQGMHEYI